MSGRVAIVEAAQTRGPESSENFLDQVYDVCREVLDKSGLAKGELGTVISAASDIFHSGMSCANAYYWDSGAAAVKNGSRNDGESLTAAIYGAFRILSGHFDTALVLAVCKGSENPDNDMLTHFFTDPFYQRQIGLNETFAAGLQMREYLERYGVSEEQCAKVVVKNRNNALRNPYAHLRQRVELDQVLNSERIMDPLKALECAPKSEGFAAVLLASEERAKQLTDKPVWLTGWGTSMDKFYLGDRDLLKGQLSVAAQRAFKRAGVDDPGKQIDVAEICEPYAFQELLWYEALGFCEEGEGGRFIDSGATEINGDLPVNPSGGVLSNNAYISRGLIRLVEVTLQLRGQAGERQVNRRLTRGLAHGTQGFAGQFHAVMIAEI